jgi:ribosomal protein L9
VNLTKTIETEAQQAAAQDAYKDFGEAVKDWNGRRIAEKEPFLAGSRAVDSFFLPIKERAAEVLGALNGELGKFLQRKEAAIRAKRDAEARRAREEQDRRNAEAEAARRREAEERARVEALEREARTKEAAAARKKLEGLQEKRDFAEAVADGAGVHVRAAEARAEASPSSIARTRGDSSLGTLRREYDFVIEDVAKIPLEELRDFIRIEDIEKAVRAMVRVHGDKRTLPGVRIFEDTKANIR